MLRRPIVVLAALDAEPGRNHAVGDLLLKQSTRFVDPLLNHPSHLGVESAPPRSLAWPNCPPFFARGVLS